MLPILLSSFVYASECTDSDGGQNYWKKGTTSGINDAMLGGITTIEDYCEGNFLYEYYCMDLSHANTTYNVAVGKIKFECLNGCNNGACINTSYENNNNNQSIIKTTSSTGKSTSSTSHNDEDNSKDESNLIQISDNNSKQQEIIILNKKADNIKTNKDSSSNNSLLLFLSTGLLLIILFILTITIIFRNKSKKLKSKKL